MIKGLTKHAGITLVEVILVMVVGAAILFFSVNQYLNYRRDADIIQLKSNVDILFDALAKYFRANCNQAPFNSLASSPYVVVGMEDLIAGGFLADDYLTTHLSPLVNYPPDGKGFILQFYQLQPLPDRVVEMSGTSASQSIGSITLWQAQVGVQLKNVATKNQYLNLTQASCLTKASSGHLDACGTSTDGENEKFLLWERIPSLPSSKANSNYWVSMPLVQEFRQFYTTNSILVLLDGIQLNSQYYVCGT